MKKILALAVAAAMAMSMTACSGGSGDTQTDASQGTEASQDSEASQESGASQDGETYTVGICQLVQHVALDAATEGFMDAIKEQLGEENVTFDLQNAQGDSNTCSTIINSFVSEDVDLILANATAGSSGGPGGNQRDPDSWNLCDGVRRCPWESMILTAQWAETFPEPLTWLPWTSRQPC